jgi:hypothetical protein
MSIYCTDFRQHLGKTRYVFLGAPMHDVHIAGRYGRALQHSR